MKPRTTKTKLHKHGKSRVREDAKEQGYYDGRFKTRVMPDKKMKQSKESSRKFRQEEES